MNGDGSEHHSKISTVQQRGGIMLNSAGRNYVHKFGFNQDYPYKAKRKTIVIL